MSYKDRCEVSVLVGKTLSEIKKTDDEIVFSCTDGTKYKMFHDQDCCESVTIDDVWGDLDSLVGDPLLIAEEVTNKDEPIKDEWTESCTWTFYKFATIKGFVDIRWYGESNGYYSESVDFEEINKED